MSNRSGVQRSGKDLKNWSEGEQLGRAGEFPFTRGIYESMYSGKLWTMRQFAGFGSPEDTNARFKYLLEQGQTGLSTAFDMPTLMGYDADHELSRGEVGREGVSISSLDDMRRLFSNISLKDVSVSDDNQLHSLHSACHVFCTGKRAGSFAK